MLRTIIYVVSVMWRTTHFFASRRSTSRTGETDLMPDAYPYKE